MEKDFTTFWMDFTIADKFGEKAILDTYNRAFNEWKDNYKYLTFLVFNLNHKIWQHYDLGNIELSTLYNKLWEKADNYALKNLKNEKLNYFLRVID